MMQTTSDNSPIKVALKQKKEAQMWANKNEVQKDNGVNLAAGNQNFVDYFVNWYKTYKEPVLSDSSKLRYRYTISIVMQYFTGRKLNQITRAEYQKFLNDYAHPVGKKEKSINSSEKVNTQIKASVRDAIEDGLITRDFTAKTTITGRPEKSKDMKYLDAADASELTKALEADISVEHATKFMALVALQTGARFSEIAGLTWDNFSYEMKTIRIEKAWDTINKNGFTTTKKRAI
ncbi:tyrosine-type recombinase/integrase [Secundilactobacillus kimchicus]|uniref:tyrosine-type recombinase/integrase n=1 Tax=Secundilactobacillus kimchicus TaxID=528209 RepID=UPI002436EC5B|nr:tyrosine-type recombinase/integrase [Secundilactobacillus kimchicus]